MNKFLYGIIILLVGSLCYSISYAQVATPVVPTQIVATPFGGKVTAVLPCVCSGSLMITLFDFRTKLPIQVLYTPFLSRLNQNFNIFTPGNAVLGQYIPGAGQCLNGIPPFCKPTGKPVGLISPFPFAGVGSSLTPSF